MNINLASTFLEIVRAGSFIAAAEKLYVTQTTVTARIHTLEKQVGCKLFVRNRSGASLTPDGQKFIEHATKMVQLWEAAKRDLPLPDGTEQVLNIGAEISLWSPLMLQWLSELNQSGSQLAIRTEIGERHTLIKKLEHGVLDAIVIHQPEYWPGVQVEQLLEEKLIMVSARQSAEPYIYIDWGEHFQKQHDAALPDLARAKMTFNLGPLALQYLLGNGGSGYFRTRVVEQHIKSGLLDHNTDYPEFTFPVYVMYRKQDKKCYEKEIKSLFDACQVEYVWS